MLGWFLFSLLMSFSAVVLLIQVVESFRLTFIKKWMVILFGVVWPLTFPILIIAAFVWVIRVSVIPFFQKKE